MLAAAARRLATPARGARMTVLPGVAGAARAHCQVPCGIFTDDGRIATLEEDAATIRKSVVESEKLHKAGALQDIHQMVRWVNTKESHATNIMSVTAQYYLARKVKKPELSKDEYHEILALHHAVMTSAMKTKQSSELAAVDALDSAIAA